MRIRKEKIVWFEERLADFFKKAGREHLPWRKPFDCAQGKRKITAYEVWVSEIMLQQTQVVRVIGYYERFLKRFPTIEALAGATWEEFLPYYEGLGYYNRGRNMLKAAQEVATKYRGRFPRDAEALRRLPGIGPYTAAAIMSFAYGDNHLAWDTNLYRVIGRFFYGTKNFLGHSERSEESRIKKNRRDSSTALGMTTPKEVFWEDKFATPKKEMNAALMDFGSALCVARPKCEACSLRVKCVYYKERGEQETRYKLQNASKIQETRKKQDANNKIRKTSKKLDTRNKVQGKSKIDWREAEAYVFLHENHKKYFSANKKKYEPFVLPSGYNTRAGIKKYFFEKYALTLAVRPPHKKTVVRGKPALFVNAQILLGEPEFAVFPKKASAEYNESIKANEASAAKKL
jgi:A/G-specific adenine glycosylase